MGSFGATLTAALLGVASTIEPGATLKGFYRHLYEWRLGLAVAVGIFALVARLKHYWEAHLAGDHSAKPALERLVNHFSRTHFEARERQNRVTLFTRTKGWKLIGFGLVDFRAWRQQGRGRYLRSLNWNADYLGVYVRARGARNQHSSIAWRISDDPSECEGVAGMIWEEGGMVALEVSDIPDPERIAVVDSIPTLDPAEPTRKYLEGTNVRSIASVKPMRSFGRHFCGTIIRAAGHLWGVLLIDSTEEVCCFGPSSVPRDELGRLAVTIGQVVGEPPE